jgi:capsule biosynthesis phosphatase
MIKRIVFDLDDVISFCHDRDWANAKPNVPLIQKLNSLHNRGWEIEIFSARGTLSGIDYYPIVSKWLEEYGVLYHSLRFGKPLATLYVDDKNCTPEEFLKMDFEVLTGWSGTEINRVGNRIIKTDKNIKSTLRWYNFYSKLFYTPNVFAVTGEELTLQYIKPVRETTFEDCLKLLHAFKSVSQQHTCDSVNTFAWVDYIDRIAIHVDYLREHKSVDFTVVLDKLRDMPVPERSLSHGDFNPSNIIVDRASRLFLVDPLNVTYSSWQIDQAKLIAWSLTHHPQHRIGMTYKQLPINTLVIAELIRTIKYSPKEFTTQLINLCSTLLKS